VVWQALNQFEWFTNGGKSFQLSAGELERLILRGAVCRRDGILGKCDPPCVRNYCYPSRAWVKESAIQRVFNFVAEAHIPEEVLETGIGVGQTSDRGGPEIWRPYGNGAVDN